MDTVNACEYKCPECSKEYKAYKSLWEHNRVHHGGKKVEKVVQEPTLCEVVVESKYPCRKCPLTYKHRQTRYSHEKNCAGVVTSQDIELEKMRLLALDKQQNILDTEQRNLKLKIKLAIECIAHFREEKMREKQETKEEKNRIEEEKKEEKEEKKQEIQEEKSRIEREKQEKKQDIQEEKSRIEREKKEEKEEKKQEIQEEKSRIEREKQEIQEEKEEKKLEIQEEKRNANKITSPFVGLKSRTN